MYPAAIKDKESRGRRNRRDTGSPFVLQASDQEFQVFKKMNRWQEETQDIYNPEGFKRLRKRSLKRQENHYSAGCKNHYQAGGQQELFRKRLSNGRSFTNP